MLRSGVRVPIPRVGDWPWAGAGEFVMDYLYVECDLCHTVLKIPAALVDPQDATGDFEHGLMGETETVIESVGWFVIGSSDFLCPAHGTREQATRQLHWKYGRQS